MDTPDLQLFRILHEERVRRLNPRAVSDLRWRRRRPGAVSGRHDIGMPHEHGDC